MQADKKISLPDSLEDTLTKGDFGVITDIGEVFLDTQFSEGIIKEMPILGILTSVYKGFKGVKDYFFAKKLLAFLFYIRKTKPQNREEAIKKWENDKNYKGKVGETLLGMIDRCDDSVKAEWLSKLFYALVLKREMSQIFMRAEKILSSLSIMDVQAFLNLPRNSYCSLSEKDVEPFLGSGLYRSPKIDEPLPMEEKIDLSNTYCQISEAGYWMYNVLNDIEVIREEPIQLF